MSDDDEYDCIKKKFLRNKDKFIERVMNAINQKNPKPFFIFLSGKTLTGKVIYDASTFEIPQVPKEVVHHDDD